MMIQLDTVSSNTNPSEYWEEYSTVNFHDNVVDTERTAYISDSTSLEDIIESADISRLIITHEPDLIYHHPYADVLVEAYDGYNE
mgnify:CR=1 FL=1